MSDLAVRPPLVAVDESGTTDVPRPVGRFTWDDAAAFVGALAASLSMVWVLYENVFPTAGKVGFFVFWYAAFIGFYALVTSFSHPRPVVVDKIVTAAVTGGAAVVICALAWMVLFVFLKGWTPLHHLNFWTKPQSDINNAHPYTSGGILNAIVGSVIQVAIAVVISVPAGIGAAVYMTEVGGRLARMVRTVVEAMTALPDLVAGLFVYYLLIVLLAKYHWAAQSIATKNGFAAAVALSITMLPIIARSSETVLRVVPSGLREAGLALGSSQWSTVWRVVLPTARPGLASSVILGIARAIGETAPLLIVSAASTYLQFNPFGSKAMNSLPLAAYNYIRYGTTPQQKTLGYATAAVLLIIVTVLFVAIRLLARQRTSR